MGDPLGARGVAGLCHGSAVDPVELAGPIEASHKAAASDLCDQCVGMVGAHGDLVQRIGQRACESQIATFEGGGGTHGEL
jgi:hypothetical protein